MSQMTKQCPFCSEQIHRDAIKCKHCHEFLNRAILGETRSQSSGAPRGRPEQNAGEDILWQGRAAYLSWYRSLLGAGGLFILGLYGIFASSGGDPDLAASVSQSSLSLGPIFGLTAVALSALLVFRVWFLRLCAGKYTITNYRALERTGLLSKSTREVRLHDILNLNVRQSLMDRILRHGTLEIASAATAGQEVIFREIPAPQGVKEIVRAAQSRLRS